MDFLGYYNLESFLLDTVMPRFHQEGRLNAFDFFSIVIWKSNRAKSRVAKRLLGRGASDLEAAVAELTGGLFQQPTPKDRLHYLWSDWQMRLPMAAAILEILYPDDFTVYDYRLCDQLGAFHGLGARSKFDEDVWPGYEAFRSRVQAKSPPGLSLRDMDRYLWRKSACEQLAKDIDRAFGIGDVAESESGRSDPPSKS